MPTREDFLRYLQQNPVGDGTPSFVDTFQGFETYFSQPNPGNTNFRDIPSTSTPPTAAHIPQMTVDDLLGAPGRESLTVLDPLRRGNATWFKHDNGKISKAILKMMKSDLPGPYPTYKHLPRDAKTRWFRAFAQQFTWEPSITETVKIAYEKKAQKSFSSNLCEWKEKWKLNKDPPEWVSDDNWLGYDLMWKDEKVQAKSSTNSTNRKSERGGFGIAIHNTGAKSYERRKDEMTIDNGGEEPDMLAFLADAHRSRKTGDILDKKVKRIVETVKEKINDQLTQGGSTETNLLTQAHINNLEIPVIKGHRFGFGTLPDPGQVPSSASFMSNLDQEEQLRIANEKIAIADEKIAMATEKIVTLENDKAEKDKVIQYLQNLASKVVSKFPDLLQEDEDATQE
ncbi:hypothetical protein HID58_030634 [Brassica napus]|uniref:Transposase, Ptta/En/Spm, plant n=1 Tax=Brassica napus TaxID=3708 RepID=A0ABQ8CGK8_BRANA|nr:hypothetical protein HID58_030634 [Brassica napus]